MSRSILTYCSPGSLVWPHPEQINRTPAVPECLINFLTSPLVLFCHAMLLWQKLLLDTFLYHKGNLDLGD